MRRVAVITCTAILLCACTGGIRTMHIHPGDDPAKAIARAMKGGGDATVILHGGEYTLNEPVVISGAGKLRICAAEGEKPVLRGDISLKPEKDADGIFHADLSSVGISDFGAVAGKSDRFDLYLNGLRQIPARWPDEGYTRAGKVYGSTVPDVYSGIVTPDRNVFCEGLFDIDAPRSEAWAAETSGAIHAFARYDWFDSTHSILSMDGTRMQVELADNRYGFGDGFRYFAYNLLCEMDRPGEYHLDTNSGVLSWYAPEEYDPAADEVSFPVFNGRFMLEISDSEDVSIEGISFRGARNGAIGIMRSSGVSVKDCSILSIGGDGISISGSRGVNVKRCIIEHCGHAGIAATGGNRLTLKAAGYMFEDNIIRNYSELRYTYQPGIRFSGVGAIIARNEICNCPSSALNITGNDIYIENNYLHDLVTESDDQGALDIFGNYYYRGIVVRGNVWENVTGRKDSKYGAAAVRLDDMICGVQVRENVFRNCGGNQFGAVQIHSGKDNYVEYNRFDGCATAVSFSPWTEERWRVNTTGGLHNVTNAKDSVATGDPLYLQRYPPLKQEIVSNVNRNYFVNNIYRNCNRLSLRDNGSNVFIEL